MSINSHKYRGTTTYYHVHAELVRAAQYRGLTTYQDLAMIMGLPVAGSHMGNQTGQILGEICEEEVMAGRPMLSCVCVGVNGKAGPGFFELGRQLGLLKEGEPEAEFWQRQLRETYGAWKRPLPKKAEATP